MGPLKLASISEETCVIAYESIGNLVRKQTKGLPFVLAVIETQNDQSVHRHYFDALQLNRHFSQGNLTNPQTQAAISKVQYLWNAQVADTFEPLAEIAANDISNPSPAFAKVSRLAALCNEDNRPKRIHEIIKHLLAMGEHTDPADKTAWTKRLYNEFLQGYSAELVGHQDASTHLVVSLEANQALTQLYAKSSDNTLLPCLFLANPPVESLASFTLDGILLELPDDELTLVIQLAYANAKKCHKELFAVCTKITQLYPDNSAAHGCLGDLYRRGCKGIAEHAVKAWEHLHRAISLDPNNAFAHASLGELYRKGGEGVAKDAAKAHEHLHLAITLDPNNAFAHAHACLGELYRVGGEGVAKDAAKAHEHLHRAITLEPNNAFTHESLAELYREGGEGVPKDAAKAREHYEKVLQLIPNNSYAKKALEALALIAR